MRRIWVRAERRINGVSLCGPPAFDGTGGDATVWEEKVRLVLREYGWRTMDPLRGKQALEKSWHTDPPCKV
ncbi:hypothetical protein [Marinivivus vitaminiproducens]|uniref:hypothetical protein n=1 Tax=Marinivivus vitaminiproducens TaxID=3035935 RepID=UPI002799F4F1|nr:hypothetical protein P4R82_01260 [Geminicoccaceae bacterium SCSIO 64248]